MVRSWRNRLKRLGVVGVALFLASCVWLPCVHLLYRPELGEYRSMEGIPVKARQLAKRYIDVWSDEELRGNTLAGMQVMNPEWDFMSRTYFVLALGNMALRDEAFKGQACEVMDAIIDDTLAIEQENGWRYFLMRYGQGGGWVMQPARSQFVDGEIALMLAVRRLVEEKEVYKAVLAERVKVMILRMEQSAVLCAESYPDECWIYCNTISVAAIRMGDVLDGTDHSGFIDRWLAMAKDALIDKETGMLISAYSVDGEPGINGKGAEGTSLWMVSHLLEILDADFAHEQYRLAKQHFAGTVLGFGYSREWPYGYSEEGDIDSGAIASYIGVSPSASGLAMVASAAFDDDDYFCSLITSVNFAGFPEVKDERLY